MLSYEGRGDRFLQTGCDGTGGDMVVGGGGVCCGQLQVIWQKSKEPAWEGSEGVWCSWVVGA